MIPLEAALSASRGVVAFAAMLAVLCVLALTAMSYFDVLPLPDAGAAAHSVFIGVPGIASAMLYAAGVAFGYEALMRTGASLLNVEEDRYRLLRATCATSFRSPAQRRRAVYFAGRGSPAWRAGVGVAGPWSVRSGPRR